jgi:hypothetical protein
MKMKTISIDAQDDFFDAVFNARLIEDYRCICASIARLESIPDLAKFQQEDLEDDRRYRAAMLEILGYYLAHDELQTVLNEEG